MRSWRPEKLSPANCWQQSLIAHKSPRDRKNTKSSSPRCSHPIGDSTKCSRTATKRWRVVRRPGRSSLTSRRSLRPRGCSSEYPNQHAYRYKDVPGVRLDCVRATAQHALHSTRRASDGASFHANPAATRRTRTLDSAAWLCCVLPTSERQLTSESPCGYCAGVRLAGWRVPSGGDDRGSRRTGPLLGEQFDLGDGGI